MQAGAGAGDDVPQVEGGCLCGAINYRVDGDLREVIGCHCSQCRKSSGHHVAATAAADEAVQITDLEQALQWYRSSSFAQRGFCGRCGSNLFWKRDGSDQIAIMAGTLNGDTGLKLEAHIFTADKGDYYSLDADVPCFAASRDS